VEQREVGLGTKIQIRRRLSASFELGDESRRSRIHIWTGGKIYMRFQSVSFVKARLQLSETLSPAKSLRSGDKDNLISLLFCIANELFGGFRRARWTIVHQH
jgi:hypothetical protein